VSEVNLIINEKRSDYYDNDFIIEFLNIKH